MELGLKGVSSLRDCWSQDWVLGIPSLACVMPVARFRDIFKYLHLNDNDKMSPRDNPDFDKLFKVRPLVDSLKANFKLQYKPHEVLSVDEAMIRFKGRTSLVQYMPITSPLASCFNFLSNSSFGKPRLPTLIPDESVLLQKSS